MHARKAARGAGLLSFPTLPGGAVPEGRARLRVCENIDFWKSVEPTCYFSFLKN
jgi:hypothetical protein